MIFSINILSFKKFFNLKDIDLRKKKQTEYLHISRFPNHFPSIDGGNPVVVPPTISANGS
jgi:hypothetical protein